MASSSILASNCVTSVTAQGEVSHYALKRLLQIPSTRSKVGRPLDAKQIYVCACESALEMYVYVVCVTDYIYAFFQRCDVMRLQNVKIELKKLF